ncbi:hypothetical protein [Acaryochloris marina]|nr:hypothetical protein [Acaryochloris marina]
MSPPLRVDDVSVGRATICVPLRSMGVTPFLHYYEDIRLPINHQASSWFASCAALPPQGRS